jgi:hypothetical protein
MKRALIALSLISIASVACEAQFSSDGNPSVSDAGAAGNAGETTTAGAGNAGAGAAGAAGAAGRPVKPTGGSAGAAAGTGGAGGTTSPQAGTGGVPPTAGAGGGTAAAGGIGVAGSGGTAAGTGGSPDAGTGGQAVAPSCTAAEALKISGIPTTFDLAAWSETTGGTCFASEAGSCSFAVDKFGPYDNNQAAGNVAISSVICDTSPKAGTCGAEKACAGSIRSSASDGAWYLPFDIVPDGDGYRLSGFVVGDQFGGNARAGSCSYDLGDAFQHAFEEAMADMLASARFACH